METALCLPVLLILALGAAATIHVADGRSGLDAACSAAVATAARAPGRQGAVPAAESRFRSVLSAYPLNDPVVKVEVGSFERGGLATCEATAGVDLSFAPVPGWASRVRITSHAEARIDDWRSRW